MKLFYTLLFSNIIYIYMYPKFCGQAKSERGIRYAVLLKCLPAKKWFDEIETNEKTLSNLYTRTVQSWLFSRWAVNYTRMITIKVRAWLLKQLGNTGVFARQSMLLNTCRSCTLFVLITGDFNSKIQIDVLRARWFGTERIDQYFSIKQYLRRSAVVLFNAYILT